MLTLTYEAAVKVKEMLGLSNDKKVEGIYLRIGVVSGGCSGFSYKIGFEESKKEDDVEVMQYDIPILVDSFSQKYLQGAVVDYVTKALGGGFSIKNPNAISSCGCGISFKTATDEGKPTKC